VNSITHLAIYPGKSRLEKSLPLQSRRWKSLLLFPCQNDAYFFGVRAENPDSQIIADLMRPKNSERSGCAPARKVLISSMGKSVTSKELMRELPS